MTVSPVAFQSPTTLQMPGGNIVISNGTLNGTGSTSFTVTAPNITFAGSAPGISTQSKAITLNGAVTIAGNSTLNSPAVPITLNGSLAVAPAVHLDLGANTLLINYSGASPVATIPAYLSSGFNAGSWNGPGIDSLAAQNDPNLATALGYTDSGSQIRIKYTYYGDNNLDGEINATDFQMFLDGLAATNASSWSQGDYTYDGRVDLGNDFSLFLFNYLRQGGALGDLEPAIEAAPLSFTTTHRIALPRPRAGDVRHPAFAGLPDHFTPTSAPELISCLPHPNRAKLARKGRENGFPS